MGTDRSSCVIEAMVTRWATDGITRLEDMLARRAAFEDYYRRRAETVIRPRSSWRPPTSTPAEPTPSSGS